MFIVPCLHVGGNLFLKPFSEPFFMNKYAKWNPELHYKSEISFSKTRLELKSKNHQTCVKNDALGPSKNEFSHRKVAKITKTRGAGKC